MNYAWPAAFAFVGMCAAIAYANVYTPVRAPTKSMQETCMEMKGEWTPPAGFFGPYWCKFTHAK